MKNYLRVSRGQFAMMVLTALAWSLFIAVFSSLGTRCFGKMPTPSSSKAGNQLRDIMESSVKVFTWKVAGVVWSFLLRHNVSYLTLSKALNMSSAINVYKE